MQTAFDEAARNYSYNYDTDTYSSLWVAYPLYAETMGGTRHESWAADPNVPQDEQINTWSSSYGVNVGSTSKEGYDSSLNYYSRGHQVPDADRRGNSVMQAQTYYATNMTPQIQNGFNGGIWSNLEDAVRAAVPAGDTLYVATGPAFRKVGETKDVTWILPKNETVKTCPVPNYYWKVLLKVQRDSDGKVTSASSIGFWFEHKAYSIDSYVNYAVSVDQIEQWTGFDFFVNLPDAVEAVAEANDSWTAF